MSLIDAMRWQMNISGETADTLGRLANSGLDIELASEYHKM
jgi:hypothetical protein